MSREWTYRCDGCMAWTTAERAHELGWLSIRGNSLLDPVSLAIEGKINLPNESEIGSEFCSVHCLHTFIGLTLARLGVTQPWPGANPPAQLEGTTA